MILSAMLSLLAGLLLAAEDQPRVTSITVSRAVVMRVPIRQLPARLDAWRERRAPRCIATEGLAGAMLSGPGAVDLLFTSGRRYRARLERACPTLDFYRGFYLEPDGGRLCAGRDAVHSRIGGACMIERFHRLVVSRPGGR